MCWVVMPHRFLDQLVVIFPPIGWYGDLALSQVLVWLQPLEDIPPTELE